VGRGKTKNLCPNNRNRPCPNYLRGKKPPWVGGGKKKGPAARSLGMVGKVRGKERGRWGKDPPSNSRFGEKTKLFPASTPIFRHQRGGREKRKKDDSQQRSPLSCHKKKGRGKKKRSESGKGFFFFVEKSTRKGEKEDVDWALNEIFAPKVKKGRKKREKEGGQKKRKKLWGGRK